MQPQITYPQMKVEMNWSYGVTTVPERAGNLLLGTLASLKAAGFDRPRLFVDGCSVHQAIEYREALGLEITSHDPHLRTFGNWMLAAWELYIRDPVAHRYAVFQDDFVCYRNLRAYLEKCAYPEKGYWNLYSFPENEAKAQGKVGWFKVEELTGRGAVALVFDRATLQELLKASHLVQKVTCPMRGWRTVDGGVVTAMRDVGYYEHCHYPSLVQHIGDVSSMGNKPHKQSCSFRGEGYDALELLAGK